MSEPMSQEDFELACAECEGVKVSTIKAWRKSTGGYSNEKIDDMYLGYSLATVALEIQKAITRRVSAESNRLFDEKAVLIKQLEAAERERDELRERLSLVREQRDAELNKNLQLEAELARRDAAVGEPVAVLYRNGDLLTKSECGEYFEICCKVETPLYTAASPAVLPPKYADELKERAELIEAYSKTQCEIAQELGCDSDNESILKAIYELKERGAQQQKVVELPEPVKWPEVPCRYFSEDQVFSMLDAANVKWEVKK